MSRFAISNLRVGPEDLREQLPFIGVTVDVRSGPDGLGYFYARLDDPIKYRIDDTHLDTASCSPELLGSDDAGPFLWVSDIVMRPSIPGEQPHFGMQRFPVDLASVIDLSLLDDTGIDFGKLLPIATAEIDDIPDQTPAEPPPEVAPPPDPRSQERRAPAADATPVQARATTAAPIRSSTATSATQLDEPRRRPTPEPARPDGRAATSRSTSATPPARPPRRTEASAPAAPRPGPDVQHRPLGPYPTPPAPPPRSSPQPPPVFAATPSRNGPSKRVLAVSAVVLVGVLLIAFAGWSLLTSDDSAGTQANPTPTPSAADVQRVKGFVPKGYLDGDCTPTPGTDRPSLTCSSNADPGGPQSATYAIYPDRQSLQEAFSTTTATFDRMVCPGNIQSPGPWRRNAAPTQVAGTLFCGTTQRGQAVVVWTSDTQSLLNVAEAGAQGPSLAQLYTWWTFHS
ncbi:hypothetical protein BH09ACT8_BH09ACT8_55780 [soil metagenome]